MSDTLEHIEHEGYTYWYEFKPAKHKKDVCLATHNPKEYCNGVYLYSGKDPGSGKCFVVVKTDNPDYRNEGHSVQRTLRESWPIMKYFEFGHLPKELQKKSKPFHKLAHRLNHEGEKCVPEIDKCIDEMIVNIKMSSTPCEETYFAISKLELAQDDEPIPVKLRLLLEAKDCAVRAAVNP